MGDVFFDLANFSVNNGLSKDETAELLRAYFGDVRPEHERALMLMRFMSDFREAMWGVVQQALSDLDFDFRGYADEHFERLERTASERSFRRALLWLGGLALREEQRRSGGRVREHGDRRHDLECCVHRHMNDDRQRADTALADREAPVHLARVRVADERVLARLQLDVEALLARFRDLGRDVDAAGPVRWKLCADDWSFTTSV